MEKVSVIIPIYNAEKQLDECIKSIIRQTHTDIELLLIDDGSRIIQRKFVTIMLVKTQGLLYTIFRMPVLQMREI